MPVLPCLQKRHGCRSPGSIKLEPYHQGSFLEPSAGAMKSDRLPLDRDVEELVLVKKLRCHQMVNAVLILLLTSSVVLHVGLFVARDDCQENTVDILKVRLNMLHHNILYDFIFTRHPFEHLTNLYDHQGPSINLKCSLAIHGVF